MTIASGINMQLAYKAETTPGTAAGQASGQLLRRVESSLDLSKDILESKELRLDFQDADYRHGPRKVSGTVKGELSPATYKDWLQALLKRDFATVTALTSVGLTIGAASAGVYPLTRAAGSWLSDNVKTGMVVRLSVGGLNAANINNNLLIVDITSATVAQVMPLNGVALVAEGPISGCTVTMTGKVTYAPTTGHTDKSFSIEQWYPDLTTAASELYLGCKVTKASLGLNPSNLAEIAFDIMGLDVADTTAKRTAIALNTQYFTSATALSTGTVLSPATGLIRIAGATQAVVTGLSIDLTADYGADAVVGTPYLPQLFPGRVRAAGTITAYFENTTLRDAFWQETEAEVIVALATSPAATADFISICMPRVKFGGASRNDNDSGKVITLPFKALLNTAGGAGIKTEKTTVQLQDSLA